jgi:YesN/AraC family two-component response regulator
MIIIGDASIYYSSSGMFKSENPWIHSERVIDSYEIIFIIKNEAFIAEDNITYELKQGDILLLEPARTHKGYKLSQNGCCFYWIHFYLNDISLLKFKHFNINDTSQKDNITFFFSQLLSVSNLTQYPPETADALCYLIINYLCVASKTLFDKSDKLINEIIEYIRLNSADNLSVSSLANYFRYNSDYLSLMFKNKTDIGLKDYISKSKINYAKSLLVTSKYSINEIADMLNFSTSRNFTSFFKYHEKISPSRYRNRNIGIHYNNK